jgi:hypothetical protein
VQAVLWNELVEVEIQAFAPTNLAARGSWRLRQHR